MPESFFGDGLIFEDYLPIAWCAGPLPHDVALARLNADNYQLLGAESTIDEVRVNDALKDESPALVHELQRLEFKLNMLLRLTSELAKRNAPLPPPHHIKLSSEGMEWIGDAAPADGSSGILDVYINSTLPQPLRLPAVVVVASRTDSTRTGAQLQFSGLSDAVVELIEKLIFRHHRRLVAGTRTTSTPR